MTPQLEWRDGAPVSAAFGDVYFSKEDGLAESRAVFLQGCGLPQAWAGRRRFVVAELGFGTGLNIVALLDLWIRTRPHGGQLHIFSLEAHPMTADDAERALAAFPEIAPAARLLLERWPPARRGFQRIEWPEIGASLDLAILEAAEALTGWQGRADAWFLDGFAPSVNPQMWRDEILDLVAARSAPGARLATFTVAGSVRRGLAAHGFEVAKVPGHGRKRERLEARFAGETKDEAPVASVAIIGGGIAAASLARAFRADGQSVRVFADDGVAASGNPAALVTPALDAGGGARAAFYAQAHGRAVDLFEAVPEAIIHRGALQIEAAARDAARFDTIAGQDLFAPGRVCRRTADEIAAMTGEPAPAGGLELKHGLVIEPKVVLEAWLGDVTQARVTGLSPVKGGWRLILGDGSSAQADIVVIAAGWGSRELAPGLPLQAIRGQASVSQGPAPTFAAAFGAYAIPTRSGLLFGATHDRDDEGVELRPEDHRRNLEPLAQRLPRLAANIDVDVLDGRAAVRVASPDRMPIAGEVARGLYVLTALGSRGFTTAPLLAEHIAAMAGGAPSPMPADLAALVNPARLPPAGG